MQRLYNNKTQCRRMYVEAVQKETFFNHKEHKAFSRSSQREECQQCELCGFPVFFAVKSTFKTASFSLDIAKDAAPNSETISFILLILNF
jgi:hypothetical protein